MHIKRVEIHNFKGLKDFEMSLEGPDSRPRRLTCLVGDNGSGKTTVLQAIALVLSLATKKIENIFSFPWPGFVPERVDAFGLTRVELELVLDDDEAWLLGALHDKWVNTLGNGVPKVSDQAALASAKDITLNYEDGDLMVLWSGTERYSGVGRFYLRLLSEKIPNVDDAEKKLGDVYWFDQYRVLGSGQLRDQAARRLLAKNRPHSGFEEGFPKPVSWDFGVSSLREKLVGWWTYHTSQRKKERDLIADLEPRVAEVFPGTRFVGVEPRKGVTSPSQTDFFFLMERGDRVYDISEMSSGEQAVFEILYEFVRLRISKSVVLIDELELHLHPPQQQALLAALPKIGPDCQFIITTHSPYIEEVLPEEEIVRMGGPTRGGI